jgi:hypothetical protein
LWQGSKTAGGYGSITVDVVTYYAHRLSAMLYLNYDLSDSSKQVNHRDDICKVRDCSNPEHLYIGTKSENALDSVAGGTNRNQNMGKMFCNSGHLLDKENTYEFFNKRDGKWQRNCRICRTEARRRCDARKRDRENHGKV